MSLEGSNILITGASGSFGNAFVDRIIKEEPARIVIYSRDEQKQETMARRLGAWGMDHPVLRFFIGDVRDLDRLLLAMHGIDVVVHAAALKIVPTAEYNPTECIATNVHGAENVVKAALRAGVKKVLALSTDKAVNPINLYGASKLCAEKIFIASNALAAGSCAFSVMRYGNVVGSRGSVVPLFKAQAAAGKPLTITDERMTRFWITLPQAVEFSINCLRLMRGREIFVPKIPSVCMGDLADAISKKWERIDIRPGEKMHETLISEDEARTAVDTRLYYIILPKIDDIRVGSGDSDVNVLRPRTVPAGFSYRSDTNRQSLTIDQIREMI